MDLAEIMLLMEEVIWNHDECCRNADWNGTSHDGEEVGFQPVDMVLRFLTVRLPNNSKYPHLFKPIILLAQPSNNQTTIPNSDFAHSETFPSPSIPMCIMTHAGVH